MKTLVCVFGFACRISKKVQSRDICKYLEIGLFHWSDEPTGKVDFDLTYQITQQ